MNLRQVNSSGPPTSFNQGQTANLSILFRTQPHLLGNIAEPFEVGEEVNPENGEHQRAARTSAEGAEQDMLVTGAHH